MVSPATVSNVVKRNLRVWHKVFNTFDHDGNGTLDLAEVKQAVDVLFGEDVPQDAFNTALKKFDKGDDGLLDINEFGELINDLQQSWKTLVDLPSTTYNGSCLGPERKLPFQDAVLEVYNSKIVVSFVATCIVGNFLLNILEKQIDPEEGNMKYKTFWSTADTTFNIIFVFELAANMWGYGGPVKKFWKSGWNVFDTIIVTVGILTMVNILGPPLDKLKLMRAFRVFRLFKRIKSLNKIIVALLNSIPGVINAFVVMFIFFCIYAIMAVELFRDFGKGGYYVTHDSLTGLNHTIASETGRGYIHGIEYYGTFMRALYTLFQVMTGESWSEAIARPLIFGLYKNSAWTVGFYYVSFILLIQLVLINVVVAVLLDKFTTNDETEGEGHTALEERLEALKKKRSSGDINSKLDQILSGLEKLDVLERSVADLKTEIHAMREENFMGNECRPKSRLNL